MKTTRVSQCPKASRFSGLCWWVTEIYGPSHIPGLRSAITALGLDSDPTHIGRYLDELLKGGRIAYGGWSRAGEPQRARGTRRTVNRCDLGLDALSLLSDLDHEPGSSRHRGVSQSFGVSVRNVLGGLSSGGASPPIASHSRGHATRRS